MSINEQKAREIAKINAECYSESAFQPNINSEQECFDSAMQMAQYKDRQFADKIKAKAKEQYNIHFGGTYSECTDALTIYNFLSDFYYEITGESLE